MTHLKHIPYLLFTLLTFGYYSMETQAQTIRFGVQAHVNRTTLDLKTKADAPRISGGFGGLMDYYFTGNWVLHTELNYTNKSGKMYDVEKETTNGIIESVDFDIHLIELPISVGYKLLFENLPFTITPRLGAYVSAGISGKELIKSPNLSIDGTSSSEMAMGNPFYHKQAPMPVKEKGTYIFPEFNRFTSGLVLGVDVDVSRHLRISIAAHRNYPFALAQYNTSGSIFTHTTYLSIGYLF